MREIKSARYRARCIHGRQVKGRLPFEGIRPGLVRVSVRRAGHTVQHVYHAMHVALSKVLMHGQCDDMVLEKHRPRKLVPGHGLVERLPLGRGVDGMTIERPDELGAIVDNEGKE